MRRPLYAILFVSLSLGLITSQAHALPWSKPKGQYYCKKKDFNQRLDYLRAQAQDPKYQNKVNLILHLGLHSEEQDLKVAQLMAKRYRKRFPNDRTVVFRSVNGLDLMLKMRDLLDEDEYIHNIYTISHGTQDFDPTDPTHTHQTPFLFMTDEKRGETEEGDGEEISKANLVTLFNPIMGRFTPDASIIIDGCKVIKTEHVRILTGIAEKMGLKTGMVYANQTLGFNYTDNVILQRVFSQGAFNEENKKTTKTLLFNKIFAGFLYPVGFLAEKFFYNKGYTYLKHNPDSEVGCIRRTHLHRTRKFKH